MPPKPKFTKEEIVDAALDIVSRDGVEAMTAREVGERLGTSCFYRVRQYGEALRRGTQGCNEEI